MYNIENQIDNEIIPLFNASLSLFPNNKSNVLTFDNGKIWGSGSIPWVLLKYMELNENIVIDTDKTNNGRILKSSCEIKDSIVENFNNITIKEKIKQNKINHYKAQNIIKNIAENKIIPLLKKKDLYQSQIANELGIGRKCKYNDLNNRIVANLMDNLCYQGIIKKWKDQRHTKFKVISNKQYELLPFVNNEKAKSKGEALAAEFFTIYKINFVQQKTFKGCKHKRYLPFDFYLEKYNLLIEIQGLQHFEFIPFFHETIENFKLQRKRDKIKRIFAEENEIELLTIRYDEDIFNALKKYF